MLFTFFFIVNLKINFTQVCTRTRMQKILPVPGSRALDKICTRLTILPLSRKPRPTIFYFPYFRKIYFFEHIYFYLNMSEKYSNKNKVLNFDYGSVAKTLNHQLK